MRRVPEVVRRAARRAPIGRHRAQARRTWILGSPRSGSTWLLQLLGSFGGTRPINEPNLGMYLGQFVCDLRGFDVSALDETNFTAHRLQRGLDEHFLATAHRSSWLPALERLIDARFGGLGGRHQVVIKDPSTSQAADLLMAAQPRARLLFLLRDGRDVVDSVVAGLAAGSWLEHSLPGNVGITEDDRLDVVRREAHKWLWRTQVVEEAFRRHPGPKLVVRYEDLRSDTVTALTTITGWLGLDVAASEVQRIVEAQAFERLSAAETGPTSFFRAASPGLWRTSLSPAEQGVAREVLQAKLVELGYEDDAQINRVAPQRMPPGM